MRLFQQGLFDQVVLFVVEGRAAQNRLFLTVRMTKPEVMARTRTRATITTSPWLRLRAPPPNGFAHPTSESRSRGGCAQCRGTRTAFSRSRRGQRLGRSRRGPVSPFRSGD